MTLAEVKQESAVSNTLRSFDTRRGSSATSATSTAAFLAAISQKTISVPYSVRQIHKSIQRTSLFSLRPLITRLESKKGDARYSQV